jgi:hypothetical protein
MTARIANKAVPDPNDLSHLSDEEFWALCPQGEHAPGPEPVNVGEVEELVAWLRHYCDEEFGPQSDHPNALQIHRTADLLERQYPQPIPVNERLPATGKPDLQVEPTDEELNLLERQHWEETGVEGQGQRETVFNHQSFARAVLARWGTKCGRLPAHALPLLCGEVEA